MQTQGSLDCQTWVDIQRHRNDSTLKRPGQYASWPVLGPASSVPYRAFRVLLEGPTASVMQPPQYNLCLAFFELYGYLYRLPEGPEDVVAPPVAAIAAVPVGETATNLQADIPSPSTSAAPL